MFKVILFSYGYFLGLFWESPSLEMSHLHLLTSSPSHLTFLLGYLACHFQTFSTEASLTFQQPCWEEPEENTNSSRIWPPSGPLSIQEQLSPLSPWVTSASSLSLWDSLPCLHSSRRYIYETVWLPWSPSHLTWGKAVSPDPLLTRKIPRTPNNLPRNPFSSLELSKIF